MYLKLHTITCSQVTTEIEAIETHWQAAGGDKISHIPAALAHIDCILFIACVSTFFFALSFPPAHEYRSLES
jgi:hypothetical protein